MQRALSIIAYALFAIAATGFTALLIVFPQVGTENGTHTLYALRRPVAVTHEQYLLVMGLLAGTVLGAIGGVAAMTLRA
jgi:hypothetical protein